MFRPRVIPVLLLKERGLVKTIRFQDSRYVGDPMNGVRIFNDLETDELIFLDITASREGRVIPLDFVKAVGDEAFKKKSAAAIAARIKSNQTVVLVSHSVATIKYMCDRLIWIENGKTMGQGSTLDILHQYQKYVQNQAGVKK